MSAKYTFLAWDTPVNNSGTKLALLQLANNADDNGFSYYSISKMAKACDMSERSFMRKIQELEKMNVLVVERRANRPSLYTLIGDEMGVTICHLQESEVTGCHAGVAFCHAEGDSLSHDPNSAPKSNPESIPPPKKQSLDYDKIKEIFNTTLTKASSIVKLTEKRKKLVKKLFDDFELDYEKFVSYLTFLNEHPDAQWMFERRIKTDGSGQYWNAQTFEYFVSEKCFLNAKENMQ
ncbi:hypothetical protein NVP1213O_60 [Vibrio phage 1.213.O._10N.222.54.F10]|nr:hypothetical protein NVP1213O_60 [Vibrio phage 1.213.O._10N.222.54.F10]